jgi:drug/metabolite transporter (DMT)-like permease
VRGARREARNRATLPAYLALLAAVAGIAWSAILVRWAGVPGAASAFYRVLVAGAVLIPWRLMRGATRPVSPRAAAVAVLGGVFFALDIALWNTSVMYTGAAVASILGNNTPVFVGFLSWLVFRKRPRVSFWIGLSLSLAGCLIVMRAPLPVNSGQHITLYGNLLAIGGSVFFAAYLVTTERIRQSMDTLTFNTLAIAGSIATLFLVCLVLRLPLAGYAPRTWAAVITLGLVSQLAAYFALVYALGHLPATRTSVGLLAQVPCTAFLAWLLLGEPLTPVQIAGAGVVLTGIYVVNRQA